MINIQRMENDIITLSLENRETGKNLINEAFITHLETLVEEIIRDKNTLGLIFTSSHKEFLLGADISAFTKGKTAMEIFDFSQRLQKVFNDLEQWPRPVVAAINGSALGVGLELALACDYRIAINHHTIKIGFPEVKMGLMPAAGGTRRLSSLIGVKDSLRILLEGEKYTPLKAKEHGLIDALVETKNDLIENAIAFIQQYEVIPENEKKRTPSLSAYSKEGQEFFSNMAAQIELDYRGKGEAPKRILNCLYETSLLPPEAASIVESQSFAELFELESTQRMIQTLYYGVNYCRKIGAQKKDQLSPPRSIGVIGAGVMGRGISELLAATNHQVFLLDKDLTSTEMGRGLIQKDLEEKLKRNDVTKFTKETILANIKTLSNISDLAQCEVIIETIDENLELKKDLYAKIEEVIPKETILITNTSSLSLQSLSENILHRDRFVGLHFFSPVKEVPLGEIVKGDKTSQNALIHALKIVHQLEKTPVVIRDGEGFFTTRIMMSYITEGLRCLIEGMSPSVIENAGLALGFPQGPLSLADHLSLPMVEGYLQSQIKASGQELIRDSIDQKILGIVSRFTQKLERLGSRSLKGFYNYSPEPELCDAIKEYEKPKDPTNPISFEDIKKRLFNIQLVETMKCFEEGVLNTAYEGDVASLLVWGFPAETGGVVSACHSMSNELFLQDLQAMALQWGERFSPPKILKTLINKNYNNLHEAREILADALLEES
ncbi:MAG: 3-hydroxyacyl-CoA dehydrogenase NAD-binding domain-containing protein [Bdellovibrionota bacterium]|nr:3-hydroxyacyl-CoA dehydrogenase NAD-binding domain-containing protein [Bdellovibrionota bacterium]